MSKTLEQSQSAGKERMRLLEAIIIKSKLACGLSVPGADEIKLTREAWQEVLEPIPTAYLQRCYIQALRSHDPNDPFKASAIFREWNRLVIEGEIEREMIKEGRYLESGRESCEYRCSAEGFFIADEAGDPTADFSKPTFAKPCPVHKATA